MSMYEEHIMDHYKRPRKSGALADADIEFHDTNPLCGDEITVYVKLDGEKIKNATFTAKGCAISQAGASMLFEQVQGKTVQEIIALDKQHILDEFGVELSVSRVKCALLALTALKKALVEHRKEYLC